MIKRTVYCLGLILLLSLSNVYGLEDNSDISIQDDIVIEINEIVEEEKLEITDIEVESVENIEEIFDEIIEVELDYKTVIEFIVQTLNKRDSYFYELVNPDDYIKYLVDLGVELPEDLETQVTRIGFVSLLNDITEKMTKDKHYETDLINILDVFIDLEGLTEEQINDVEIVFIEGLLSGTSMNTFSPNSYMTKEQLDIVMNRLLEGYNRENLFSLVDSCYTLEEREEVLEGEEDREVLYNDTMGILNKIALSPVFNSSRDVKEPVTVREFLMMFSDSWSLSKRPIEEIDGKLYYIAKDTSVISEEEWDYFITQLDRPIMLSEANILCERGKTAKKEIDFLFGVHNFEEALSISENYFSFIYELVEKNEDCLSYFLDFDADIRSINYSDFARAIHEMQHEESATLSQTFKGRRKTSDMWYIDWSRKPRTFYYMDITNGEWVDSISINMPYTSRLCSSRYPENIREDSFVKLYALDSYSVSNIYGLQGLLQEFCSYALQSKIEIISYSLDINNPTTSRLGWNKYLIMKVMVIDYIQYLKEENIELYERFMRDTDIIRMINNIFEELDFYYGIYTTEMNRYLSDEVIEWEKNVMNSVFPIEEIEEEFIDESILNIE